MKHWLHSIVILILFYALLPGTTAVADSLVIGSVDAPRGGIVELPLTVLSSEKMAGINAQISYDAVIFTPLSAVAGEIASSSHHIDAYSPSPGRMNLVVWDPGAAVSFYRASGEVLRLRFQISPYAVRGKAYPISFANKGLGIATASGISNLRGGSVSHTPVAGFITINYEKVIQVKGTLPAGYAAGILTPWSLVYGDKTCLFSSPIPPRYLGQTYLRTLNADADATTSSFMKFLIGEPATIYIAMDDRITTPPTWISSWQKRKSALRTTDSNPSRVIYSKVFQAGTVSLGAPRTSAMPTGRSMYSVIIGPIEGTGATNWALYE